MPKRFISIWFRYLETDWLTLRRPHLKSVPFVIAVPDHGRLIISAVNRLALQQGIDRGMAVADARAMLPSLQVINERPGLSLQLLRSLAISCIRYSPIVAIDPPDGIVIDATGCAHLWGGELSYLHDISHRLSHAGYNVSLSMADTIGAAWAMARFGQAPGIIETNAQQAALLPLPPAALRLDEEITDRLQQLGLKQIRDFIGMPRVALRRRFGQEFIHRIDQVLGAAEENIQPVIPPAEYEERLPCPEPITTATGISFALERLLEAICRRLQQEEKGLREACFKGFRVDGKIESIRIGTNRPSHNPQHLFKLFELNLESIEPDLGIELFMLEASKVEACIISQEKIWEDEHGLNDLALSELLDRISGKFGAGNIHRYLPDEHYWPERSIKNASSLLEKPGTAWPTKLRPLQLLLKPEMIEVTAPIPDYPPMLFRYKGKLHKILKADGPERIEQEWWLQQGQHRDYYAVEDEEGCRYWLFRSGHYSQERKHKWFIHGFFA